MHYVHFRDDTHFPEKTRPYDPGARPQPSMGRFFVLDKEQAQLFADLYFDGWDVGPLRMAGIVSPKILLVKPGERLSWQYHRRRAETWRVIEGPVGIARSLTDEQGPVQTFNAGETVVLEKGERHRLAGLENWGVVAEFWQHVDPNQLSNEEDIVRVQDDYSRNKRNKSLKRTEAGNYVMQEQQGGS